MTIDARTKTLNKSASSAETSSPAITPACLKDNLNTLGDIARFNARAIRMIPDARKYSSEVMQQTAALVLGSGAIIWAMQYVVGSMCGTEGSYTLRQIGAPLFAGMFNDYCGLREMAPYMWGYMFAAKVGCGFVAELGAMRVSDEIDALEVMGVHSLVYLVSTRLLATWLAMPFLYVIGLGVMYVAGYLTTAVQLGGISSGGYLYMFWLYQNPADFLYSLSKVVLMGTVVTFTCCYYGFTATGGPEGVGKATARSMMLNMVLIHIVGALCSQLFWGMSPNAPVSN